eukprot:TRINITY_DN109160_c0_g1_i1.p1 TRINITY_DN109160_c0_g1~~TRINITY_DN109160_c0_g1_i1.p1  ORF type:complete len:564 (-),score=77.84 TRINITY_DN109160_c0_g1_i1:161-1852(-)
MSSVQLHSTPLNFAQLRSAHVWIVIALCFMRSATAHPNIIHIMADDLGRDNLGWLNGNKTSTPHIDSFFSSGLFLSDYYAFKICAPSRASTMTGRYPFNVGFYGDGEAQHITNFSTTALLLKKIGYATHAVGKWHIGYVVKETTATFKGFDTFFGYYMACNEDLFYHTHSCSTVRGTDMSRNIGNQVGPAQGENRTYSTRAFGAEAVRLIREHDPRTPLYMYVAPQNVHLACGSKKSKFVQGIQAPCETVDMFTTVANDTYKGQSAVTKELDYLVGNITEALQAKGGAFWNSTLIVFTSDNGGPLDHTTNFPLRGGKHSFWDGGVRVLAGLGGGLLPPSRQGMVWSGLAHSADWFRTLTVGVAGLPAFGRNTTGPVPDDSINLWPALVHDEESPRTQVILQVENKFFTEHVTAIRVGSMKLILGPPGDARMLKWPELLPTGHQTRFGDTGGSRRDDNTSCLAGISADDKKDVSVKCHPGCLFNLTADPGEQNNLYNYFPDIVRTLKAKLSDAGRAAPPPAMYWTDPTEELNEICKAQAATGYLEPLSTRQSSDIVSLEVSVVV